MGAAGAGGVGGGVDLDLDAALRRQGEEGLGGFLGDQGKVGGALGVLLGISATAIYAAAEGLTLLVPRAAIAGGLAAACLLGALAGFYPAMRASRLTPTEALGTT